MVLETFFRKPSGLEAFFIDLDECGCNMTFHFYLKLNKEPSVEEINIALRRVLETHSGLNLKYVNDEWHKSDYIPECDVRHIDGADLYSYKPTRIDFRKHTIAANILHMVNKDEWHLCFDFFHGAVDGRSGIQFIYDFFDILNGNQLIKNEFGLSDRDIVSTDDKTIENPKKIPFTVFPKCNSAELEPRKNGEASFHVMKHDVCVRSLAAKLSWAVGQCFSKKSAKMIIPVDVRRFAGNKEKAFYGNLFIPAFVDVATLNTVDELRGEIVDYVKQQPLLNRIAKNLSIYSKISPKIRKMIISFFIPIVMSNKRFIYCALVSPLGVIDSQRLVSENIKVEDVSVTFATFPFTAFNVISLQYDGHTKTTVAWNKGRVSDKTASKLICNIENCMSEKNM